MQFFFTEKLWRQHSWRFCQSIKIETLQLATLTRGVRNVVDPDEFKGGGLLENQFLSHSTPERDARNYSARAEEAVIEQAEM